jgi:hypothetical protein
MTARRIGGAIALLTLVVSGYYVIAYLYWWEWNRALIAGVFFLATEIALFGLVMVDRIGRIERQIASEGRGAGHDRVVGTLRTSAPPHREHFAWLDPKQGQLNVFVPILLGAGVLLSGMAWLVERLARAVATPTLERDLATKLDGMSIPAGGFLRPADAALLSEPHRR